MDLQEFQEKFKSLSPQEGISFLYNSIESLSDEEKLLFLLPLVKDESSSPMARAAALKFLREMRFNDPEVFEKCLLDPHLAVANAARRALKDYEEQDSRNTFITRSILSKIQSLPDKQKRLKIIKAIARLQASWVPKVLLETLNDPSEDVRNQIVKLLGEREFLSLNLIYSKLVKSPWYVKSAALKVMAIKKDPDSIKYIEQTIEDSNVDVRRTATRALGEIGGKEALRLLVRLAKDSSPYVRSSAEEALRKASEVKFS
jgi:HEAT repeat protein